MTPYTDIKILGHTVYTAGQGVDLKTTDTAKAKTLMAYLEAEGFCEAITCDRATETDSHTLLCGNGPEPAPPILIHGKRKLSICFEDGSIEQYDADKVRIIYFTGTECTLAFAGRDIQLSNIKSLKFV